MNVTTEHCARCETPLESGDLRCSICGQATPVQSAAREHLEVQILRCTGCGAAMAYDPDHQAPSCSFCGEVVELQTLEDPMEQTDAFLPFTLDRDGAGTALRHWLGSLSWFRPSDLKSTARLEELRPLWWAGWLFDAEALVSWSGDSNAGSRRSSWAPHAGQNRMIFDDILVSASRGLTDQEIQATAPGCDFTTAHEKPSGATPVIVEQFDLQRSQARRKIVDAIQRIATSRVQQQHIPGSRYRNVHVSVLLRALVTRRLSFPAWVLAYRYRDRLYRVVVCGQDGSRVAGKAPLSITKVLLVTLGVAAAAVAVIGAMILGSQ